MKTENDKLLSGNQPQKLNSEINISGSNAEAAADTPRQNIIPQFCYWEAASLNVPPRDDAQWGVRLARATTVIKSKMQKKGRTDGERTSTSEDGNEEKTKMNMALTRTAPFAPFA